jgi:multisubunit Na+/H+ antiporter MnhG subunit
MCFMIALAASSGLFNAVASFVCVHAVIATLRLDDKFRWLSATTTPGTLGLKAILSAVRPVKE